MERSAFCPKLYRGPGGRSADAAGIDGKIYRTDEGRTARRYDLEAGGQGGARSHAVKVLAESWCRRRYVPLGINRISAKKRRGWDDIEE